VPADDAITMQPPRPGDSATGLPSTLPLASLPVVERKEPPTSPAGRAVSAAAPTDQTPSLVRTGGAPAAPPPPPEPSVAQPRLRVVRGQKLHVEYPIREGPNDIGRRDDVPLDIDLGEQEPADRVWSSRRHARLTLLDGILTL